MHVKGNGMSRRLFIHTYHFLIEKKTFTAKDSIQKTFLVGANLDNKVKKRVCKRAFMVEKYYFGPYYILIRKLI